MRQPELGEMVKCRICGKDMKRIDHDWLRHFEQQPEVERKLNYDEERDCFLGYDKCEHDENEHEEPGIKEEHRSYIRGTSYRPY